MSEEPSNAQEFLCVFYVSGKDSLGRLEAGLAKTRDSFIVRLKGKNQYAIHFSRIGPASGRIECEDLAFEAEFPAEVRTTSPMRRGEKRTSRPKD